MALPPKGVSSKRRQVQSPKPKQKGVKKKKRPKKAKKNVKRNVALGALSPNPLMTPVTIRHQGLAALLGSDQMTRPQICKHIFNYAKEHALKDPNDNRIVVCDETLRGILRVKSFNLPELAVVLKPLVMTQRDQQLLREASTTAYRTGQSQPRVNSSTTVNTEGPQSRPVSDSSTTTSREQMGFKLPSLWNTSTSDRIIKQSDVKIENKDDNKSQHKPPHYSGTYGSAASNFDVSQLHHGSSRPYAQQQHRPPGPQHRPPGPQHRPPRPQHGPPERVYRPPTEVSRSSEQHVLPHQRGPHWHWQQNRPPAQRGRPAALHYDKSVQIQHNRRVQRSSSPPLNNHPPPYLFRPQHPPSHVDVVHSSSHSDLSRRRKRWSPLEPVPNIEGMPVVTEPPRNHTQISHRRCVTAPPINQRENVPVSRNREAVSSAIVKGCAPAIEGRSNSGCGLPRRSAADDLASIIVIDDGDAHSSRSSNIPADAKVNVKTSEEVDSSNPPPRRTKLNKDDIIRDILDGLTVDVHDMAPISCTLDIALMMTPRVNTEWEAKHLRFELHWEAESNHCRADGWQRVLDFRPEAHPDFSAVPRIASTVSVAHMIPSQPYSCTLKLRRYCVRVGLWESRKVLCNRRIPQRERPKEWSTAETSTFASSLRIPRLSTVFLEFGINGEALMRLNSADFKALGVTAPFLLKRITCAVENLKEAEDSATTVAGAL